MIYQPTHQIRRTRRSSNLPPLGLRNLGNTCYLNSVLQCLTYTPPLSDFCLSSQHSSVCSLPQTNCPFCILEKRICRNLTLDTSAVDSPSRICSNISLFADNFRISRQEDAHEFLRYVVDACHNACLRVNKLRGKAGGGVGEESVVKEIFGGELRSQVKCLSCGGESNKIDEIMDINLDLFEINSVKDALQRFFRTEVLNGNNKYKCEKCDKLVVAKKQMSIMKAPNVLVIQLKRFEGIHGGKIDRAIAFEESLALSSYMCSESQDHHPEYSLCGTIVHSGYSPESGHYYSYIKDAVGRWYCCDDSIVSLSTLQEVLSEKVYILFFTRTSQRPQPPKIPIVANGVKPPSNGIGAQNRKEAVPSNSLVIKPHGTNNFQKVTPAFKIKKTPSVPRIKFGDMKSCDSKGNGNATGKGNGLVNGNGNGNGNINGNGSINGSGNVKKHNDLKEVKHMEKIMKERPSVANLNDAIANICVSANGSVHDVDPETKHNLVLSHQNGNTLGSGVKLRKAEMSEDGEMNHVVENGNKHGFGNVSQDADSITSGCKRRVSDGESGYSSSPDGSRTAFDKLHEMLERDSSMHLRSCSWYDEVYNFMRAQKKLCIQTGGSTTSGIELRELLPEEARKTFQSQIPLALKAQLVTHLRSFHERKQ